MTVVALVQMASGPSLKANLLTAKSLVEQAADSGAKWIVLPENFCQMPVRADDQRDWAEVIGDGPIQEQLSSWAQRLGVWLVGGSIPTQGAEARVRQTCLLYNDEGSCVAHYNKMHLFDVEIEETGEQYRESEYIEPGERCVVVDTPIGKLGLALGYDLRFPELFREMLDEGMEVLMVPSAFNRTTGMAHWESLVKARSIENLCYVVASAQGGFHVGGRESYGHSMVVNHWGQVLTTMKSEAGVALARIDVEKLRQTRAKFPTISHRRAYSRAG